MINARSLKAIDNKIWNKHGWESGGEIQEDANKQRLYDEELSAELSRRGIGKGQVNPISYLNLEDWNYHTLNSALERLKYYPDFKYSELRSGKYKMNKVI